jgi:hypothetical protein
MGIDLTISLSSNRSGYASIPRLLPRGGGVYNKSHRQEPAKAIDSRVEVQMGNVTSLSPPVTAVSRVAEAAGSVEDCSSICATGEPEPRRTDLLAQLRPREVNRDNSESWPGPVAGES